MPLLRPAKDDLSITAPVAGRYQVEVYGYRAARYRLTVDIADDLQAAAISGGRDPDKPDLTPPSLGNSDEPNAQFGLDTPGAAQQPLYLPLVQG